ncbi:MAG: 4-alpha-glucanotransferase, partial [Collinsella sp.]
MPYHLGAHRRRQARHDWRAHASLYRPSGRYGHALLAGSPVNPTDFFRSPYAGPSAFAGNIDLLPESQEELAADFETWKARGGEDADPLYTAFKHRNADWLEKYCVYMAVKKYFEGESRHDWPADVARYNEHLIDDKRFHDEAELQAYMQYRFDLAWCELMNYAHKKGIEVIGDIPMYV